MRINYTTFYVVESTSDSSTDFLGSIQKRSEELVNSDGETTNVTFYDESTTY